MEEGQDPNSSEATVMLSAEADAESGSVWISQKYIAGIVLPTSAPSHQGSHRSSVLWRDQAKTLLFPTSPAERCGETERIPHWNEASF